MSVLYRQCISAITIPGGEFINNTFVVAADQSGISVGQFSPNPTPLLSPQELSLLGSV
jgi:hypothetical protein